MKAIETSYKIYEVSGDGLLKCPAEQGYGHSEQRFWGTFSSMEAVDAAILENGENYTDYVVLTTKRIGEKDDG